MHWVLKRAQSVNWASEKFIENINQMESDWSETHEHRRICNCIYVKEKDQEKRIGLSFVLRKYTSVTDNDQYRISMPFNI